MPEVAERLSIVEEALAQFVYQTEKAMWQSSREMKAFREEGRILRERSAQEMKEFKDEMKEFKDEMKEFKDEMKEFKVEMYQDRKNMNKQWGDLANRLGTIVEDIVAPAVRPAIKKYFNEETVDIMLHRRKFDKSTKIKGEFDVLAFSNTTVYVVETKAYPDEEKLMKLKNKTIPNFRHLFPEYQHLKIVPIFSSLRFEEDFIEMATKVSIYLLAYREWDFMDILNFEEIKKGNGQ